MTTATVSHIAINYISTLDTVPIIGIFKFVYILIMPAARAKVDVHLTLRS